MVKIQIKVIMFREARSERSSNIDDKFWRMFHDCHVSVPNRSSSFREHLQVFQQVQFVINDSVALRLVHIIQKRSLALCKQIDIFILVQI